MTDLAARIAELGPWFHNLRLNGIETAPDHPLGDYPSFKWRRFRDAVPDDLTGMSVLDIGCNAGFYSIEMTRRGAARVVAIDSDTRYLAQARLAAEIADARIEFRHMSVYDVEHLRERFDLVLFMGVFYHLRHPLLALDLLWEHAVGDLMVFQSMQRGAAGAAPVAADYGFDDPEPFIREDWPRMWFIEERFAGDPTNWFIPNPAATRSMLRSAGFRVTATPEAEVYLCHRTERPAMVPPPPRIAG